MGGEAWPGLHLPLFTVTMGKMSINKAFPWLRQLRAPRTVTRILSPAWLEGEEEGGEGKPPRGFLLLAGKVPQLQAPGQKPCLKELLAPLSDAAPSQG